MIHNFDGLSDEEFRRLEKESWDGALDYNNFPAAEYKFFDTVAAIGYRHRHDKIPAELLKDDILQARKVYEREAAQFSRSAEMYRRYQAAILRSDELKCRIQKSRDVGEALGLALECIELLTGEEGFAKRSIDYIGGKNE